MSIASVGIDIGKLTFHLVTLDAHGKVVVRKEFSQTTAGVYGEAAHDAHWRRGLLGRAFSRCRAPRPGSRRAAHPGAVLLPRN